MFVIGQQLTSLINESFSTGVFPEALKKSTIIPIHKKPWSIAIEDHRPINLLNVIERLIESLGKNQECISKMFADDTLVYIITDTIKAATLKLNEDLDILFRKLCQNKLRLNVNKTKVMIISNKKTDKNNVNIYINGTRLEIEKEIKYLGVLINDNLNSDKNIDHLCKKIGSKTSVMGRLRNELNCEQKLNLYKSIIEPYFMYCASILYLSNQNDLNRLQKLQNKYLRQILKTNKYSNS